MTMEERTTQLQENPLWAEWLKEALKPVDDHPDREWVRQELLEHLDDKAADLKRAFSDLTEQEAERETLLRMGDPSVVGAELAKAHGRVLGTVYWITDALIRVGLLGMLLTLPLYLLWFVIPLMLYSPPLI